MARIEMLDTPRMRFPIDISLDRPCRDAAHPLSYPHPKEVLQVHCVFGDHSSINRWAIQFLSLPETICRRKDETFTQIKSASKYFYRAVDKFGRMIDFVLTEKRYQRAAKRVFDWAINPLGRPEKLKMHKSGANKAAIAEINATGENPIFI